ncbi:hypothetical protein Enr10x_05900 [Gimesia panareensis]|uniref:Uncharacterized protein n=1 Tax=Gimesia panareensis TaxID=2527978 RepID=A0A517Q0Z4_9PLAN|nr:hypothetical protein Enr10x_05900 [Gimesia panareensis]
MRLSLNYIKYIDLSGTVNYRFSKFFAVCIERNTRKTYSLIHHLLPDFRLHHLHADSKP